jgi:hypothetical protein
MGSGLPQPELGARAVADDGQSRQVADFERRGQDLAPGGADDVEGGTDVVGGEEDEPARRRSRLRGLGR